MPQMNGLTPRARSSASCPKQKSSSSANMKRPKWFARPSTRGSRFVVKSTAARELLAAIAKVNKGEPFVKAVEHKTPVGV